jgi:carboxymethylenebutenolidase
MKPIHPTRLRASRRLRQFNLSLLATLAVLALTACGGGDAPALSGPVTTAVAVPQAPAPDATTPVAGLLQEDGSPMPEPTAQEIADGKAAAEAEADAASGGASAAPVAAGPVNFTNSDGLAIPARLYLPTGAHSAVPTVVMLHGCAGVYSFSDPALGISLFHKDWAQRLNAAGYGVLLVDSFTPRGTQNQCNNGTAGVNEAVDRPKDAKAALKWLIANGVAPADRVALLGWSNGGSATMATLDTTNAPSGQPRFAGGVAFYPGCGLLDNFGGIASSSWLPYAPLQIFHGSVDPLYTAGSCDTRVDRAHTAGAAGLNLTVYTGARHSFDQASAVKSPYTQSDVDARQAADVIVMERLSALLAL